MHFEGRNYEFRVSKCIKLYIFLQKKKIYVCLPFLKCSDPLPETHLFFIWSYSTDGKNHTLASTSDFYTYDSGEQQRSDKPVHTRSLARGYANNNPTDIFVQKGIIPLMYFYFARWT